MSDRFWCNLNIRRSYSGSCLRHFNTISSGAYTRPHRHKEVWADDIITRVYDSAFLVVFDDCGCVDDVNRLGIYDQIHRTVPGTAVKKNAAGYGISIFRRDVVVGSERRSLYFGSRKRKFASWSPAEFDSKVSRFLEDIDDQALQILNRSEERAS